MILRPEQILLLALGQPVVPANDMGKGEAPPAPDYAAAARAQGGANLQSTIASNVLNRPTEITPLGTRRWTQTGTYTVPGAEGNPAVDIPTWESRIDLTPEGQMRYDQEQRIIRSLGDTAEYGLNRVGQAVNQPFDMSQVRPRMSVPQAGNGMQPLPGVTPKALLPEVAGIPDQNNIGDTLYRSQTRYMDPQFQQQGNALESKLVNQGLRPGTEAYDTAMRNFQMDKERAYADARDRSILASGQEQSRQFGLGSQQFGMGLARGAQDFGQGATQFGQGAQLYGLGLQGDAQRFGQEATAYNLGQQGRQADIAEQAYLRQLPLNELNALRTGSQVSMPQFQSFSTANMQPAPIMQGAIAQGQSDMARYNAEQAQGGEFLGGLMKLGGTMFGGSAMPWWMAG